MKHIFELLLPLQNQVRATINFDFLRATRAKSILTTSLLSCNLALGLSYGYAEEKAPLGDTPFTVPTSFSQAGAPTFTIPTTKVVVLTAAELNAAIAHNTIAELINRSIESNTLIKFPSGTYNIPEVIFLTGVTNVVLEGAVDKNGKPATTLNFTHSLTDLYGNNTEIYGSFGAWHGGGGFINVGTKHPMYAGGVNKSSANVGIKNFNITFNRTVYHISKEDGYNALYFSKASNSYAQNITVTNYDSAIILSGCTHTTVKNATLNAIRNGHFGAVINAGSSNLIENLTTLSPTSHPLSLQKTTYNVFKNCTTAKGAGDGVSYRGGCSNNLFWNINSANTLLGASNGQNKNLATTYGKNEYYWNCKSQGVPFSASKVPSFLNGYVRAYNGPQSSPF